MDVEDGLMARLGRLLAILALAKWVVTSKLLVIINTASVTTTNKSDIAAELLFLSVLLLFLGLFLFITSLPLFFQLVHNTHCYVGFTEIPLLTWNTVV